MTGDDRALAVASAIMRAALLRDPALAVEACVRARELVCESPEYALCIHVPWPADGDRDVENIIMRAPCRACSSVDGTVSLQGGQHVVRCASCNAYAYCRPRAEASR